MTTRRRVAAVVLNFRHIGDTLDCVRALQRSDHRDLEILVVDNAAEPASHSQLRSQLDSRVELIPTDANLGYAGGNNIGIRVALDRGVDHVWIVNPDVVVEPDTLRGMLAVARRHPDAGCIGSRMLLGGQEPARVWFDGGRIDWSNGGAATHLNAGAPADRLASQGARPVDYVTGASLLVSSMTFDEIGLLPEEYFLYFEETDFCVRARGRGWSAMVATDVVAWHHKRSSGNVPAPYYAYYWPRGRALFAARYCAGFDVEGAPDFREWYDGWLRNVSIHAAGWVPEFKRLVELGLTDGLSGRTGRRSDIEDVQPAILKTSPASS